MSKNIYQNLIAYLDNDHLANLLILSLRLHRMHESGLMNKWVTEQIPTKDKCSDISANQGVNERKVNVADMQGIFFVLFMGNIYFFLASTQFKNI